MNARRPSRVAMACVAGFMLILGAVTARIALLQTHPSEQLARFIDDRTSSWQVEPIRGDLRDRRGRVISTSRFEYRLAIDPTTFPDPPDAAIVRLAEITGIDAGKIGSKVVAALGENDIRRRVLEQWTAPAETPDDDSLLGRLFGRLGIESPAHQAAPMSEWAKQVGGPPPIIRYVPIEPMVDQATANAVRLEHIRGVSFDRVAVRDYPGADLAAALIGKVGYGHVGLLGAETAFDRKLGGEPGRVRYVRDHRGRPLWVGAGDWSSPVRGDDIRLSIDLAIQMIATEELKRGIADAGAAGGRLVVMDPATGEILAMVDQINEDIEAEDFPFVKLGDSGGALPEVERDHNDWPRYRVIAPDPKRDIHPALGRNRCIEDIYEPGSTFKPFIWSLAYEQGLLPEDEIIRIADARNYRTPYGRRLADVTRRGELSWPQVLLFSSNIGMSKVADRLDPRDERQIVRRLGFGAPTGLGLPGEASGLVTSARNWTQYTQTSVAIGYEVGVTPVQMVRAFSAFARSGDLAGTIPELRLTASSSDDPIASVATRIYQPDTALAVRKIIEGVVERMDTNRRRTQEDPVPATYRMFGKSGTAKIAVTPPAGYGLPKNGRGYFDKQYNSSFIAGAPFEDPRVVVLVIIDDPKPELVRVGQAYGSWVAGPVVRRVVERTLRYLGVEPDRADEAVATR